MFCGHCNLCNECAEELVQGGQIKYWLFSILILHFFVTYILYDRCPQCSQFTPLNATTSEVPVNITLKSVLADRENKALASLRQATSLTSFQALSTSLSVSQFSSDILCQNTEDDTEVGCTSKLSRNIIYLSSFSLPTSVKKIVQIWLCF